jgi:small ligand-binding sensory domain FIST
VTRYVASLSEHPLAAQAVGEVVGAALEQLSGPPDLAVVFFTGHHLSAAADVVGAIHALLEPDVLIGASASSVLGGAREVEDAPGLVLWAAHLEAEPRPVRLETLLSADGELVTAGGAGLDTATGTLVLLADPFTVPVTELVAAVGREDLRIVGGLASAASRPGDNVLVLGERCHQDGAVGVVLPPEVRIGTVVSQGCRPIGHPFVVTRAEGNVIHELAGRPALERLMAQIESLDPPTRALAAQGLHVGIVIDEHREHFDRGDFLIRGVLGADRERGAVAVGEVVEVGATVQFQVRDATSADEDLTAMLEGTQGAAAMVFTCNGRGTHLFGIPHHDASVVTEQLGTPWVAGMFAAGELGPVGTRSFVHGFTASIAVFDPVSEATDRSGEGAH